jgi:predicted GIY-YIG superfamily endonuclease
VKTSKKAVAGRGHHAVYVVYLKDPKGDGKAGYYVGMTGLTPEERFQNHKNGVKAASIVRKHGVRLVPKLYEHLNPMPYEKAKAMETVLAESLRKRGYQVFGGH